MVCLVMLGLVMLSFNHAESHIQAVYADWSYPECHRAFVYTYLGLIKVNTLVEFPIFPVEAAFKKSFEQQLKRGEIEAEETKGQGSLTEREG